MSNNNNNRITIGQYNIISTIGTGSFGKVKCKCVEYAIREQAY